ncbi:MAG: hypothetical protein ACRDVG_07360, partial [Jatrophihabitantaceae bacterium]
MSPRLLSPQSRRLLTALLAAVALVSGALALILPSGGPAHREASERASREQGRDGSDGGDGEHDGGPVAPADYLTRKFTSGKDVTPAQVRRAQAQANALPSTQQQWQLVGPSNIGGRMTGLAVDPRQPDTLYAAASGGGIWK